MCACTCRAVPWMHAMGTHQRECRGSLAQLAVEKCVCCLLHPVVLQGKGWGNPRASPEPCSGMSFCLLWCSITSSSLALLHLHNLLQPLGLCLPPSARSYIHTFLGSSSQLTSGWLGCDSLVNIGLKLHVTHKLMNPPCTHVPSKTVVAACICGTL